VPQHPRLALGPGRLTLTLDVLKQTSVTTRKGHHPYDEGYDKKKLLKPREDTKIYVYIVSSFLQMLVELSHNQKQ
jgi:hypothetical protein